MPAPAAKELITSRILPGPPLLVHLVRHFLRVERCLANGSQERAANEQEKDAYYRYPDSSSLQDHSTRGHHGEGCAQGDLHGRTEKGKGYDLPRYPWCYPMEQGYAAESCPHREKNRQNHQPQKPNHGMDQLKILQSATGCGQQSTSKGRYRSRAWQRGSSRLGRSGQSVIFTVQG
jgi:hypothetical protein